MMGGQRKFKGDCASIDQRRHRGLGVGALHWGAAAGKKTFPLETDHNLGRSPHFASAPAAAPVSLLLYLRLLLLLHLHLRLRLRALVYLRHSVYSV